MCPVLFEGTAFRVYSLMPFVFIGFAVSTFLFLKNRPQSFPMKKPEMFAMSASMLLVGIFLAKSLYACLFSGAAHKLCLSSVCVGPRGSGYVFSGTLATELLMLGVFTKLKPWKISFFNVADYIVPFLFLFQSIASIGLFLFGLSYGKPTSLPWGVVFKTVDAIPRHPTQIYSAIFLFCIYLAARYIYRAGLPRGVTFLGALSMYGVVRFFNEFLRVDSPKVLGPITLAQVALLSLIVVSVFSMLFILSGRQPCYQDATQINSRNL